MSYYDPYQDFDYGQMDPNDPAMQQALLEALMSGDPAFADVNAPMFAGGQMEAMMGLISPTQPSGKPMTPSNITGALSAYRSGMFDTAFQGLGGMDTFAADAFEPTVTTTIRQEPELQQVYSYLRSPTSMEGIITQELMAGGTPSTAKRQLQQMLTAAPEEVAAIFARYDQLLGREPTVTAADVPSIQANLRLELPPMVDDMTGAESVVEEDGTGADWGSVMGTAGTINELNAQIPRVGPSGPKWGTDPTTGQPIQISAGGELQWGQDETGAPVMIEVTSTPSKAAKTYDDLGLPYPTDEYTAQDFQSPDITAMQEAYAGMADPVAQLKQAWMDPALNPSMQGAGGPSAQLAGGGPYVPGAGAPGLDTTRYDFPETLNYPGGDTVNAPGPGDTHTTANQLLPHDPGALNQFMAQVYPTLDRATQDALANYLTSSGQGDAIPAQPRSVMQQGGQPLAAPDILPEDPGAMDEWMRQVYPTLNRQDQDAVDTYLASIGGGSGAPTMAQQVASGQALGPPTPTTTGGPPIMGQLADMFGVDPTQIGPAGGQSPPYAQPGAQPANQPGGAMWQNPQLIDAMLSQILPGNQQSTMNQPPAYAQPGAQAANQPGGAAHLEAVETGERRADQRRADERSASVLGGSTNRTGKRVRATRTGEQARQYRQAFDAWDAATDQQQQLKQQSHNAESGRALGQAWKLQAQGVRPLDQVLMARRLVMMGAGMPSGRIPGL